eukprot:SAG31_NODE_1994_length_6709_cov_4.517549_3_plen_1399_part_00
MEAREEAEQKTADANKMVKMAQTRLQAASRGALLARQALANAQAMQNEAQIVAQAASDFNASRASDLSTSDRAEQQSPMLQPSGNSSISQSRTSLPSSEGGLAATANTAELDAEQQKHDFIEHWANLVAVHGPRMEELIKMKNAGNPAFAFLFTKNTPDADLYQVCLQRAKSEDAEMPHSSTPEGTAGTARVLKQLSEHEDALRQMQAEIKIGRMTPGHEERIDQLKQGISRMTSELESLGITPQKKPKKRTKRATPLPAAASGHRASRHSRVPEPPATPPKKLNARKSSNRATSAQKNSINMHSTPSKDNCTDETYSDGEEDLPAENSTTLQNDQVTQVVLILQEALSSANATLHGDPVASVRAFFDVVDIEDNGWVHVEDFVDAIFDVDLGLSDTQVDELVNLFDHEDSGQINYLELVSAVDDYSPIPVSDSDAHEIDAAIVQSGDHGSVSDQYNSTGTSKAKDVQSSPEAVDNVAQQKTAQAVEEPRVSRSLFRKKAPAPSPAPSPAPPPPPAPSPASPRPLPTVSDEVRAEILAMTMSAAVSPPAPAASKPEPIRSIVDEVRAEIDEWKARNADRTSSPPRSTPRQRRSTTPSRKRLSPSKKKSSVSSRLSGLADVSDREQRLQQRRYELEEQKRQEEKSSLVPWTVKVAEETKGLHKKLAKTMYNVDNPESQLERHQKWIEARDANLQRKKAAVEKARAPKLMPQISPKSKQIAGTRTRDDLYTWHEEKLRKQQEKQRMKKEQEYRELGLEPDLSNGFARNSNVASDPTKETASFRRMAPTLARDVSDIKHSRAVDEDSVNPAYDTSPLVDQKTVDKAAERLHGSTIGSVETPQIDSNPNLEHAFAADLKEPSGISEKRLHSRPTHHTHTPPGGYHSPHVQPEELMARPDGMKHASESTGRSSPTHREFLEARKKLMTTLSTPREGSVASSMASSEVGDDDTASALEELREDMESAFESSNQARSAGRPELELPSKAERKALFQRMDVNGNGMLSLAEIDKCIVEQFPAFDHKPALMRAYKVADSSGNGLISRREFKSLLHFLVYFNNKWEQFETVDADGDRRISLDEFQQFARSIGHGLSPDEAAADFAAIDKNGGGYLLFDEFCAWCAHRHLGESGDVSDSDGEEEEQVSATEEMSPNTKLRQAAEFIDGEWRQIDIGTWTNYQGLDAAVAVLLREKGVQNLADLLLRATSSRALTKLGLSKGTAEKIWGIVSTLGAKNGETPPQEEDPFTAMETELVTQKHVDEDAVPALETTNDAEANDDAFAAMEAEVLAQSSSAEPKSMGTATDTATEPDGSGLASFHEQAQKLKHLMKDAEHKFGLAPGEQRDSELPAQLPEEKMAPESAQQSPQAAVVTIDEDPFAAMEAILLKGAPKSTAPEEEADYEAFLDSF